MHQSGRIRGDPPPGVWARLHQPRARRPGGECDAQALLTSGNIETVVAPNLRYARWEKLCWNIPFNGLSVAGGGIGTQTILGDPELRETAERAMREVVLMGNADLVSLKSPARLPEEEVVGRMFSLTETMGDYRTSMVIDYVLGIPSRSKRSGNPVRRAGELDVAVPTVEALHAGCPRGCVHRGETLLRPEDLPSGDSSRAPRLGR
ncbi:ketopantoate reductase C-terminal domain-containing protein [Candidatus Amarobacter glycogenicus]|uniref:ketopantoate reductase C-terminal domain-containing protein n=1 Tax=Candidatus Amarobacter glycogenicus TaxID=3140699 RepID=UPI003135FE4D|nr:hypothetical protein [Dehalococcoidia bacterium]